MATFDIEEAFLHRMLSTRSGDGGRVFPHVSHAAVGAVLRAVDTMPVDEWRRIEGYSALAEFRMYHPVAFKISTSGPPRNQSHSYMALFQDHAERPLSASDARLLSTLHGNVRAALARTCVPLLATEPILAQIMMDQSIGYFCVTKTERILESNHRAHMLVDRVAPMYGDGPRARRGRTFVELVLSARARLGPGATLRLPSLLGGSIVVSVHNLDPETHSVPGPIILMMLREDATDGIQRTPDAANLVLAGLPPRLRQVAELLAGTSMPYKHVALELGLAEGTIRKHAERLYRALRLSSRAELMRLLRER